MKLDGHHVSLCRYRLKMKYLGLSILSTSKGHVGVIKYKK